MTDLADRLGPDKVKLGVCCTLWWNDDFPAIDAGISFGQAVSEMALAGFQGCSIGHKYPSDAAALKAALDLRGLRVSEPWTSTYFTIDKMRQKTIAAFEETLAHIKALGGTELVVAEFGASSHLLPVDVFANRPVFTDAQWDALTSGLDELGKIAGSAGMKLSYHHHMGTGVMTRADVDRLMASTDPALVHLLLDTAHIAFAERRSTGPGPGTRRPHRPRPHEEHPARGREPGAGRGPVVPGRRRARRLHRARGRRDRLPAHPGGAGRQPATRGGWSWRPSRTRTRPTRWSTPRRPAPISPTSWAGRERRTWQ
ncbi:TIM barrel protein [Streptomyces lasalocidi]